MWIKSLVSRLQPVKTLIHDPKRGVYTATRYVKTPTMPEPELIRVLSQFPTLEGDRLGWDAQAFTLFFSNEKVPQPYRSWSDAARAFHGYLTRYLNLAEKFKDEPSYRTAALNTMVWCYMAAVKAQRNGETDGDVLKMLDLLTPILAPFVAKAVRRDAEVAQYVKHLNAELKGYGIQVGDVAGTPLRVLQDFDALVKETAQWLNLKACAPKKNKLLIVDFIVASDEFQGLYNFQTQRMILTIASRRAFPHELFHYATDLRLRWSTDRDLEPLSKKLKELARRKGIARDPYWGKDYEFAARAFEQWFYDHAPDLPVTSRLRQHFKKWATNFPDEFRKYYLTDEEKAEVYPILEDYLRKRGILGAVKKSKSG